MFDQRLNQVAAQVAKMTPQQRQQFAMLHKNDPIIVSLTKFVNDQENAVRSGMEAAKLPEAVSQPKVVDQAIAQMVPAPQITPPPQGQQQPQVTPGGVNQLPAPNLASMPDGGIAGYADGGKVRDDEVPPKRLGLPYGEGAFGLPRILRDVDVGATVRKFGDRALQSLRTPIPGTVPKKVGTGERPTMANDPRLLGPVKSPMDLEREANMAQVNAPPAPPQAPVAPPPPEEKDPAREALLALVAGGGGGGGGGGGRGAPAGGGLASLGAGPQAPAMPEMVNIPQALKEQMANLPTLPPEIESRMDAVARERASLAQEALSETEKRHADAGIAGLDREKRLKEREGKLAKSENENTGLALLSAGLAMMAGTSPNAMANIGAGAQVGLQQYAEGKQRLDAARERLDDHFSALEELRRNERNMNAKELSEARMGIKQAALQSSQEAAQAVAQMYGVNRETAIKMVDAGIRQVGQHLDVKTKLYTAQLGADVQLRTSAMDNASRERAAATGAAASRYSARVGGLASLARQQKTPEDKQNELFMKAVSAAQNSMKNDPEMKYPDGSVEYMTELQRRAAQIMGALPNQRGLPQSPASSAAQPTFRFNPQSGNVEPYR